jgi:drug/metabolite transporter (DMT)-like permease
VLFCAVGVYSTNNNTWDVWMVGLFGLVGYIFHKLGTEPAPLLLGFILGPMMEENLRRACCCLAWRLERVCHASAVGRPAGCAFSGKAIIVKLAYRYGVDAVTLIMYRMLFALPLFAAMAWWASRGKAPLAPRDWLGVLGLGVFGLLPGELSGLCRAGLHHGQPGAADPVPQPDAGAAAGLGAVWARHPRGQALGMAISYCGVVLVFGIEAAQARARRCLGRALVFWSAVSYAIYLVYSGEMVQRLGALRLVGLATTVACVLLPAAVRAAAAAGPRRWWRPK